MLKYNPYQKSIHIGLKMTNTFDTLLLIGRPASGKSEIIDFLKRTPKDKRQNEFHIGDFIEIDDFPMLWVWIEEDGILEELGYPPLHHDENKCFKHNNLWDLLIRRICLEHSKYLRDNPAFQDENTIILEFSRGTQHGGYKSAFEHIDPEILSNMAIFFNNVNWEESLRKNRKRFNPDKPDSILEHGLTDQKLEFLYKEIDWKEITEEQSGYIEIKNIKVPFFVFDNKKDVTSASDEVLGTHLKTALGELWKLNLAR